VQFHEHRGPGGRLKRAPLTPQQQAAAFERALEWRREWRTEMAGRANADADASHQTIEAPQRKPRPSDNRDAAKFAAGIARAEFGRFYWDARKERPSGQAKGRVPK
jgi:hypothetical protein